MDVLYITPNSTDPLAFYRGTGPLRRMREQFKDFRYTDSKEVNWSNVAAHDMVFIQRPFRPEHLDIVKIANTWQVPVVADFDDWLGGLATSNPAYEAFQSNRGTFLDICSKVNGITVATQKLADLIEPHTKAPIKVVPNGYDPKLFPYTVKQIERNKIALWRGGNSHIEDLMSVKEEHAQLINDFPDWQFAFIHQQPWWLPQKENVKHISGMGIMEYMRAIHDLSPAVMYHPLTDTDFNRAKSMCSWLEASHARAAFVGPDFEEFDRTGINRYKKGEFYNTMSKLMLSTDLIANSIISSRETIKSSLTLEHTNKIRMEFFNEIVNNR